MSIFKKFLDNFLPSKMNESTSESKESDEDNSIYEYVQQKVDEARRLAYIINTTIDENEFLESFNGAVHILEELIKYENKIKFDPPPSRDLEHICSNYEKTIDLFKKRVEESKINSKKEAFDLESFAKECNKFTENHSIENNNANIQAGKNIDNDLNHERKTEDSNYLTRIPSHLRNDLDEYFEQAGKIIIENNNASIGKLQRVFKIGFNRAAKIMDQLCEFGVVGEEEGTKPRKILMTMEEFLSFLKNHPSIIQNQVKGKNISDEKSKLTLKDFETIMQSDFGINADYSNDGTSLSNLKNSIVPSITNENQTEFIDILLKYNSPKTMGLILIDNSVIAYSEYIAIPHLIIPIVTNTNKIDGVINWCTAEMEDRIRKLVRYGVKNIDSYNDKINNIGKGALTTLPRIVIIVNETNKFFDKISTQPENLFMNSNTVGIYFILFSRFSLKRLRLGIMEELLEIFDYSKLAMLISRSMSDDKCQHIAKNFDDMDGHQFEYYCAELLKNNSFKNVEVTQGSGDHGIDILADKEGITYAIQCKCYSFDIGNAAVQQAYTGKGFYHKDIAVVLTNRYFTPQAKEEAQALGVKLWDRDRLNELINNQGR